MEAPHDDFFSGGSGVCSLFKVTVAEGRLHHEIRRIGFTLVKKGDPERCEKDRPKDRPKSDSLTVMKKSCIFVTAHNSKHNFMLEIILRSAKTSAKFTD
jgi:hypothetical protein